MIDEYFFVEANRLSPEFPIPIYVSPNANPSLVSPGGAANVAKQLVNFNVHSYLFGFRNKQSKLAFSLINAREGLGIHNNVKIIPRKIRLYNGDFPLCRWDIETNFYGTNKKKLLEIYNGLFKEYDRTDIKVAILSDYNKGFWNLDKDASIWIKDKITIVDPKKGPLEKWKGCTIFKPNTKEAEELSGQTNWKKTSRIF
jgi:bifunctional ADP-heptose synthase (sugar kinase/adenylyltransferase)